MSDKNLNEPKVTGDAKPSQEAWAEQVGSPKGELKAARKGQITPEAIEESLKKPEGRFR